MHPGTFSGWQLSSIALCSLGIRTILSKTASCFFLAIIFTVVTFAQDSKLQGQWVTAWSTAVHTPLAFPGMPPTASFENQTVRLVIRPTIGGQRIRILFTNELGNSPLAIGGAHIALLKENGTIVPGSDRSLTFGGEASDIKFAPPIFDGHLFAANWAWKFFD